MRLFEVLDIGLDTAGPENIMQILSGQLNKNRNPETNTVPSTIVQGLLAPFDLPIADPKGLQDFFKDFKSVKEVTPQGDVVLNIDNDAQGGQVDPDTVDKMARRNAKTLGK
jgi:hypothetical protein